MSDCHEHARSALECGGLTPPSPLALALGAIPRRRQAAALQGASRIFMAARNLALPLEFEQVGGIRARFLAALKMAPLLIEEGLGVVD